MEEDTHTSVTYEILSYIGLVPMILSSVRDLLSLMCLLAVQHLGAHTSLRLILRLAILHTSTLLSKTEFSAGVPMG